MASVDDLPADQQAVLRLLLGQGRAYGEIASTLRMAPAAVRDRAHDALTSLGPADSPLGRERRAQVADWLLSQQTSAERESTEDLLRSSAGARAWARSVSAELNPLAESPLPQLPEQEPDDASPEPATSTAGRGSSGPGKVNPLLDDEPATPAREARGMTSPVSRRGGVVLLSIAGMLAALAVGFFVGRATKDDAPGKAAATQTEGSNLKVLGQTNLRPPAGSRNSKAVGIAQFAEQPGKDGAAPQKLLNVLAQGLPAAPEGTGYGVWLTRSGGDPVWMGYFQAVTTSGEVAAQSPLKVDPADYDRVILTRQRGAQPKTPSTIYLQGPVNLTAQG